MELILKKNFEEAYVWVPFVNANVMGKFIEEGLYPHLYKISPEMFDVIEPKKTTKKVDDLYINTETEQGNTDAGGTHSI